MHTTTTFNPSIVPLSQRREDYRLEVPTEDEAFCTFTWMRTFEQQPYSVTLEICDISAGGLSVADYDGQLADVVGSVVKSCALQLPNQRKLLFVDLNVLRAQDKPLSNRCRVTKVSCQFVQPADAVRVVIRRYSAELERRQIARERGLD